MTSASVGSSGGDFQDPVTSPNDPIFMFHHANLDRNAKQWMANNADKRAAFYEYPASGTIDGKSFVGMFLADVTSSAFPFTAENLGFDDFPDQTVSLT